MIHIKSKNVTAGKARRNIFGVNYFLWKSLKLGF